jgi:hypothetical protein
VVDKQCLIGTVIKIAQKATRPGSRLKYTNSPMTTIKPMPISDQAPGNIAEDENPEDGGEIICR